LTPRDPLTGVYQQVAWTPRLSVGVAEIDAQHRELYRRVDDFLRAVAERRARTELHPLVRFLTAYAREHFATEQQMMELSEYTGMGDHMAEHQWFEEEYGRLVEQLDRDGATSEISAGLVALLTRWLDHHLETTDRALGQHLEQFYARRRKTPSA
jgi:hemerythrin